jgi:hypothetical protein
MHRSDDDIPPEIDFSGGERGKFYRAGMQLKLPLYLDEELQTRLARLASARGVDVTQLVNELLRDDLERMGA